MEQLCDKINLSLENGVIHFDNPTAVYKPGEILSGKIEINFPTIKRVKGISVVIKGKSKVFWRESRNSASDDIYYAIECYFNQIYKVVEALDDDTTEVLSGQQIYPFKYVLPDNLPPSYEGQYGNIRYSVKAVLYRPWKFNQKVKSQFVVETSPEFNEDSNIYGPVTFTMEKYFGVWPMKSGPLTGIVTLPHTGFECQKNLPFSIKIINNSNVTVKGIIFRLIKIEKFLANHPRHKERKYEKPIWKSRIDCHIEANNSTTFDEKIEVPQFPIYNLTESGIIDIEYEIKIEVQTSGLHLNMYGHIPVYLINSRNV